MLVTRILPIYLSTNEILRQPATPITEITEEIVEFIPNLIATKEAVGGIGLAANQVGKNFSIICVGLQTNFVFINPKIIEKSDETFDSEEMCLSIPGVKVTVPRHKYVKIKYQNIFMEEEEFDSEDSLLLSACLQHEIDHLYGILITDNAPEEQLKEQSKLLSRINKKHITTKYLSIS